MSYSSTHLQLPQEILDLIMEELFRLRDTNSLYCCLTVAKSIYPAAYANMWRTFPLTPKSAARLIKHGTSPKKYPQITYSRGVNITGRIEQHHWDCFVAVAPTFKRITHANIDLRCIWMGVDQELLLSPIVHAWDLVSMTLKDVPLDRSGACPQMSCSFFRHFANLKHLTLNGDGSAFSDPEAVQCVGEFHDELPRVESLTISTHRVWSFAGYHERCLLEGHLVSTVNLRRLHFEGRPYQVAKMIMNAGVPGYDLRLGTPHLGSIRQIESFGNAGSLTFTIDTDHDARDSLTAWAEVFHQAGAPSRLWSVTIEVQLHLCATSGTAPKIRFPAVWKALGCALVEIPNLRHLTVIFLHDCTVHDAKSDIDGMAESRSRLNLMRFMHKHLGGPVLGRGDRKMDLMFVDLNLSQEPVDLGL